MKNLKIRKRENVKERAKKIMQSIRLPLLLMFVAALSISCDVDDDKDQCATLANEFVTAVEAPETGVVNQTLSVEVQFNVANSCGEFSRFIETGTVTDRTIAVESVYIGCACSPTVETITATYQFVPATPGEYELNFVSGPGQFITVTINVTAQD